MKTQVSQEPFTVTSHDTLPWIASFLIQLDFPTFATCISLKHFDQTFSGRLPERHLRVWWTWVDLAQSRQKAWMICSNNHSCAKCASTEGAGALLWNKKALHVWEVCPEGCGQLALFENLQTQSHYPKHPRKRRSIPSPFRKQWNCTWERNDEPSSKISQIFLPPTSMKVVQFHEESFSN